jgi:hypothetical protein
MRRVAGLSQKKTMSAFLIHASLEREVMRALSPLRDELLRKLMFVSKSKSRPEFLRQ